MSERYSIIAAHVVSDMEIRLPRLSVILNVMIVTDDALMPISRCLYDMDVSV